jgi:hypothetical protein
MIQEGARPAFARFAWIWAVATLVHQVSFTFWMETWQGWLLTFATCLVVLEPRCVVRFTALIVFSLVNWWYKLPFLPNHMLWEGMLNLSIFLGLLSVGWRFRAELPPLRALVGVFGTRFRAFLLAAGAKAGFLLATEAPRNPVLGGATSAVLLLGLGMALAGRSPVAWRREEMLAAFAPVLRVATVVMYWWAAVQKTNWDYLNPEVSCGAELHREIAEFLPFVPTQTWALYGAIYGSLALEFGIPVLLIIRRLRPFGFLAAIPFHLWLSVHPAAGVYSFSSLLFALYLLFLPRSAFEEWDRFFGAGAGRLRAFAGTVAWEKWLPRLLVGVFLAVVFAQTGCYLTIGRTRATFEIANRIGFFFWFAVGLCLGGSYFLALWRTRHGSMEWRFRPTWNLAWIGVALVAWNGLNPWIGLKTQTSFSMYSNLRSEGFGNHVFLKRVDLFGFQKFANRGNLFPYFELRRLVSEQSGDVFVRYRRGGVELVAERRDGVVTGDERLFRPIPWLPYKLLWFRRMETFSGPMNCTH